MKSVTVSTFSPSSCYKTMGLDAIQPSHILLLASPPALNLSQNRGLFLMSRLFTSGGQIIGASASASVLPMNIQD